MGVKIDPTETDLEWSRNTPQKDSSVLGIFVVRGLRGHDVMQGFGHSARDREEQVSYGYNHNAPAQTQLNRHFTKSKRSRHRNTYLAFDSHHLASLECVGW